MVQILAVLSAIKQREDRLKIQFFVGGTDVTTVVQLSFYFRICSSFFLLQWLFFMSFWTKTVKLTGLQHPQAVCEILKEVSVSGIFLSTPVS